MEIAIAVMIVGLLTAIVIPIVRNQVAKLDEYSYYAAYKSVEKLGGQIVALGLDPCAVYEPGTNEYRKNCLGENIANNTTENTKLANLVKPASGIKFWFASLGNKFVYSEQFLFKKLFPKSYADNDGWDEVQSWNEDLYQEDNLKYRLCNGEKSIVKTDAEGNPMKDASGNSIFATAEDLFGNDACVGYTTANGNSSVNSNMKKYVESLYCAGLSNDTMANFVKLKSNENRAEYFCKSIVFPHCQAKPASGAKYIEYKVEWVDNQDGGYDAEDGITDASTHRCAISRKDNSPAQGYDGNDTQFVPTPVSANACAPVAGYYGMYNEDYPNSINCQCIQGYELSQNNDKVCCQKPNKSNFKAYASSNNTCVNCEFDFNTRLNKCCTKNAKFNGTSCQCINGYRAWEAKGYESDGLSPKECKIGACVGGSHLEEDDDGNTTCVANSPIIKATDLCKSIKHYWNIESSSCSLFDSKSSGLAVNEAVYNAAKGTNGKYLSVASTPGAFSSITPHIELVNGLKLWILGDKTASIPGLSYNPISVTSNTQNMCIDLNKNTATSCSAAGGYFCKTENHCFKLDNVGMGIIGDARNCCASTDLSTLEHDPNYEKDNRAFAISGFTVFVDINGTKGSGTLWEDVFPFFVGANGTVYPGYPLDGVKAKDTPGTSLYIAGNGVQDLAVDVFYYESHGTYRQKITAYPNVSYARGACFAKKVKAYTPYCQNLGLKARGAGEDSSKIKEEIDSNTNPCTNNFCLLSVRKKVRFF